MVLKGYSAKVYGIDNSVAFSTAFTTEATTEGSNGDAKIYQINEIGKRLWDPNEGITLDAGLDTPTLDESWKDRGIDWLTGRVKLNETGLTLTVSGKHFSTLVEIGEAYNWTLDIAADVVDVSAFGDEWKKKTVTQKSWSGSFEKFAIDDYWFDIAKLGKVFLVKLYTEATKGYQGFCVIPGLSSGASVADVLKETINFESHWLIEEFDEL